MAEFCTLLDKNTSPNHPYVKAMPKSSCCEDFGIALTLLYGKVWIAVKACKKCAKIDLGRVPSFFLLIIYSRYVVSTRKIIHRQQWACAALSSFCAIKPNCIRFC